MIGADLRLVPTRPFTDPGHYVYASEHLATELCAVWANQFDNLANREGHRTTTGPEILAQVAAMPAARGRVSAFTCSCGTGGTLAGVAIALKAANPTTRIVLADPEGSGLYGWVKSGDLSVHGSSITEGVGQSRIPDNLAGAPIDDAVRVTDPLMLEQVFDLMTHDGLSVGGFAGLNVAAAIEVARRMDPGNTVVPILCDGGRPLPVETVQPGVPARQGPAHAALAALSRGPVQLASPAITRPISASYSPR